MQPSVCQVKDEQKIKAYLILSWLHLDLMSPPKKKLNSNCRKIKWFYQESFYTNSEKSDFLNIAKPSLLLLMSFNQHNEKYSAIDLNGKKLK